MPPRYRRRALRVIAAISLLLSLTMATLWARSMKTVDYCHGPYNYGITSTAGWISIYHYPGNVPSWAHETGEAFAYPFDGTWLPGLYLPANSPTVGYTDLGVAYWLATFLPLMFAVIAWRLSGRWRPIPKGCCPNCGYDLRASQNACPECGHPI